MLGSNQDCQRQQTMASTGSSTSPSRSSPFTSLPTELKREILRDTGLVMSDYPFRSPQGLTIASGNPTDIRGSLWCCGRCSGPDHEYCYCRVVWKRSPACHCFSFPRQLFTINREVSYLAREITFSENRLYLAGNVDANRRWLMRQPIALLSKIRALDLVITDKELYLWKGADNERAGQMWTDLVATIENRLNLNNLTLSINTALVHEQRMAKHFHVYTDDIHNSSELHKKLTTAITAPLVARRNFRSLRDFFVFWPLFDSVEAEVEKRVMGSRYKSEMRGKAAHRKNCGDNFYPWWE